MAFPSYFSNIASFSKRWYERFWSNQVLVAIFLIVALVAFNLVWLVPALKDVEVGASRLALKIAERGRAEVDTFIQQSINSLEQTAERIALDPKTTTRSLAMFFKHNQQFFSAALIDRTGKEVEKYDRFKLVTHQDLGDHFREPGFYLALEGGVYISDVKISEHYEPFITISVPVRLSGKPKGVLSANLNIKSLIDVIDSIAEGQNITVYVLDQNGTLILHPDVSEILKQLNFADRPTVQKVLRQGVVVDGLNDSDWYRDEKLGRKMFVVGVPIIQQWGLFVEQPRREAFSDKNRVIVLALVTIALGIVLVLFLVRVTHSFIKQSVKLARINERLNEILEEQDVGAKMLVRRDLELTEANEKLRMLDKVKSDFVSVAAHQLRTPLSAVKWGLRLLINGDVGSITPEQKHILEQANEGNERMIRLVNDMLDVDRIESGKFRYRFVPVDLPSVIDMVLKDLLPEARKKHITLECKRGAERLPHVNADPEKIRAVIQNLIENAIRYTMDRGKITIATEREENSLRVSITDTGIGIPPEQQKNIFKRFFRGTNAIKMETSGSGLGLFIAKSIIEKHGGNIGFQSTEGKGTTFYFSLPLKDRKKQKAYQ
jgi:signal transduction histidine kinase